MFILLDYYCSTCDKLTESLQERGAVFDYIKCGSGYCSGMAGRTISPVRVKTPLATVSRGPVAERPANALDTRPLAEGMSHRQWRKQYSVKR